LKILINTASTFKGGGVQVAASFINECKKIAKNQYYVVLGESVSKAIDKERFPNNFIFLNAPFRPATRFFKWTSHNKFLKDAEKEFKPDVVFTTSGPSYWRPKKPHVIGYNIPHYVYKESPYFKLISLKKRLWWKAMTVFGYYNFKYNGDAFVVQTDDIKLRLKKFIKTNAVHTVSNTINSNYLDFKAYPKKIKNADEDFKLLTLSAWYPHKNLSIIPEVIKVLHQRNHFDVKFVVPLSPADFDRLSSKESIINVGPVKIQEAPSLYKECDAMFLPTLLECFSASYVEAMKMEKPILTSNLGFAHTVCKKAAIYFDPMNAEEIASCIIQLKEDKKLQHDLIKAGNKRVQFFGTPFERAEKYLDICEQLISK